VLVPRHALLHHLLMLPLSLHIYYYPPPNGNVDSGSDCKREPNGSPPGSSDNSPCWGSPDPEEITCCWFAAASALGTSGSGRSEVEAVAFRSKAWGADSSPGATARSSFLLRSVPFRDYGGGVVVAGWDSVGWVGTD